MEFLAIFAGFAFLVTLPGVISVLLSIAIGYVLRKYVEKKWPNQAALLDQVATVYGKQAQAALINTANKVKAELD